MDFALVRSIPPECRRLRRRLPGESFLVTTRRRQVLSLSLRAFLQFLSTRSSNFRNALGYFRGALPQLFPPRFHQHRTPASAFHIVFFFRLFVSSHNRSPSRSGLQFRVSSPMPESASKRFRNGWQRNPPETEGRATFFLLFTKKFPVLFPDPGRKQSSPSRRPTRVWCPARPDHPPILSRLGRLCVYFAARR